MCTASVDETAQPVWTYLERDLHLVSLDPSFAPVGLLEMIAPQPSTALDVGCFCGASGRWLKQRFPGVRVTGVEMLSRASEIAARDYDIVINKRFEEANINTGQFDVIVAADVLEHMVNPWKSLQKMLTLLSVDGSLYVSVPNVRNLRVIMELCAGRWTYEPAGILDITHLRFFTRHEVIRMLEETGWRVVDIKANPDMALQPLLQQANIGGLSSIDSDVLSLRNLTKADIH